MRILLVNDDGIHSPGLRALAESLEKGHELWIVAPEDEKSGASHSMTLHDPVRTREVGSREISVKGTPVDCVLVALHCLLQEKPDIVISGINLGANLGADILYSGTAAGARQAAILGVPGVAVSVSSFTPPYHFNAAVRFVAGNLEDFVRLWEPLHFLNINVPNSNGAVGEPLVVPPAKITYKNHLSTFSGPRGEQYHFYLGPDRIGLDDAETTDVDAAAEGRISLTPVPVYPTIAPAGEKYKQFSFNLTDCRGVINHQDFFSALF